ncbi:scavenger receptor class B member 1 [Caerostris darwini]|uniref:Scavenger receptor class B member 1 n=1 Tax=Caerostris darwini TaxID=1538125 RepID=A0AAV4UYE2_9ARAC|nr:scavenger receptor class B member 1 [Caerostris darwini]
MNRISKYVRVKVLAYSWATCNQYHELLRNIWPAISRIWLYFYQGLSISCRRRKRCCGVAHSPFHSKTNSAKMAFRSKPGAIQFITGGFLFIVAFVAILSFPKLYKVELQHEITLMNNTLLFDIWKDLPIPIYQKFYFFNISNSEHYLNNSDEKMIVQEVGPYTYSSRWVKENITWNDGTITYREVKTFHFEQELSEGSEEDIICTINGPYAAAANLVGKKESYVQNLVNIQFKNLDLKIIIKKAVKELSFEGYKDKLLSDSIVKKMIVTPYKDGIFAWFYDKNATDDGMFTVFTGHDDLLKLNFIQKWNGKSSLNYWKNDTCNAINGTNAELGPPLRENQTTYTFFQPLACRSLTFDYVEEKFHKGFKSKRFQNTRKIFANELENPDNYCFTRDQTLPSGVLDISSCQYDAPIYLSFPHFYLADPYYLKIVHGLRPNSLLHKSYIDVEPITGVSVGLAMRVQVNVHLEQNSHFVDFENVISGIYPVFWTELSTEIDDNLSKTLKEKMDNPKKIGYSVLGALFAVSLALLSWGAFIKYRNRDRTWKERQPLLDQTNNIPYHAVVTRAGPLGESSNIKSSEARNSESATTRENAINSIRSNTHTITTESNIPCAHVSSSALMTPGFVDHGKTL